MADDELCRGHEFGMNKLLHAGLFVMEGHALSCPTFFGGPSRTGIYGAAPSSLPRVMKQILLGVTAMVAKVSLCERSQPRGVQSSRPRKVLFPQHPLDPDVDRKGAQ